MHTNYLKHQFQDFRLVIYVRFYPTGGHMAKRFKEEEIVKILKEAEELVNIREVIRKHNIS